MHAAWCCATVPRAVLLRLLCMLPSALGNCWAMVWKMQPGFAMAWACSRMPALCALQWSQFPTSEPYSVGGPCSVQTINELGRKARDGTLSIDEMAGGTFTIRCAPTLSELLCWACVVPPVHLPP